MARRLLLAAGMTMNKWIVGALAVAVLAGSGEIGTRPATASGNAVAVAVTNVPLPVTGTVSASVAGTVAASQAGTWTVDVAGTPSVVVAASPLPRLKPFRFNMYSSSPGLQTITNDTQDVLVLDAIHVSTGDGRPVFVGDVSVGQTLFYESVGFKQYGANELIKLMLLPGESINVTGAGWPISVNGHYELYQQ